LNISKDTIEYSYFLNTSIVDMIYEVSKFLDFFRIPSFTMSPLIPALDKIKKVVAGCGEAIRLDENADRKCQQYCRYFKFNANSPQIEGYSTFFKAVIQYYNAFLSKYSDKAEKRRLGEIPVMYSQETMNEIKNLRNFYDKHTVDPNYDDYILDTMFEQQYL